MSADTIRVRPCELRPGDVLTGYGEPRTVTFHPTPFRREVDGSHRLRVLTTAGIVTWALHQSTSLELAEVRLPRPAPLDPGTVVFAFDGSQLDHGMLVVAGDVVEAVA